IEEEGFTKAVSKNKKRDKNKDDYQPVKIRSDIEIKKLFQKEKQEIVGIFEKFKNRTLKQDNAIAKYLDIQHVELVCIIKETVEKYDYIHHKIAQEQQTSTKEMELLEINKNKNQPNKSMSTHEENKESHSVKVNSLTHDKVRKNISVSRWAPQNRVKDISTNQTQFTQKANIITNQSHSKQKLSTIITIWGLPKDA
ncbi:6113_t:CDS:2, partial [Gigaspora rosea]